MSKYQEYTQYADKTATSERINRFSALDAEQKAQLVDIITRAKAEQLQGLDEVKIRPLFEYSGIEPEVIATLVPIILDISAASKELGNWESNSRNPSPDRALYSALEQKGEKAYAEEYYGFCSNLRHEYLLNKLTNTYGGFPTSVATKLITPGYSGITKYITENPLALIKSTYPIETLSTSHTNREAANADFTLSSSEITLAVTTFLLNAVQALHSPAPSPSEEAPAQHYSDPMSGDLTAEQYAEKQRILQDLQNRQLLVRAVENGDIAAVTTLLTEKHIDPIMARENGGNALVKALCLPSQAMFNVLWNACPKEKRAAMMEGIESADKMEILSQRDEKNNTPLHWATAAQITAMLAGVASKDTLTLLSQKDRWGHTPLDRATAEQITAMLAGMESKDKLTLLSQKGDKDASPLHGATVKKIIAMLAEMESKDKLILLSQESYWGFTPMYSRSPEEIADMLAGMESKDKLTLLLQKNQWDYTLWDVAIPKQITAMLAGMKSTDKLTLLLQKDKAGKPPLHGESVEKTTAMLEGIGSKDKLALLKQQDKNGNTALHGASAEAITVMFAGMESADTLMLLSQKNDNDATPLDGAIPKQITAMLAGMKSQDKLTLLSQKENREGNTFLHYATSEQITATLEGMESTDKTTLLSQKNSDGYTPLHMAAENGDYLTVNTLLEHGADATQRCNKSSGKFATSVWKNKGATAADLAHKNGFEALAEMLQTAKNRQQGRGPRGGDAANPPVAANISGEQTVNAEGIYIPKMSTNTDIAVAIPITDNTIIPATAHTEEAIIIIDSHGAKGVPNVQILSAKIDGVVALDLQQSTYRSGV